MSQQDKYFTFPIAFLQLGKSLDDVTTIEATERARLIVNSCLWQMTLLHNEQQESDTSGDVKHEAMAMSHEAWADCENNDMTVISYMSAQVTLGIRSSQPYCWEEAKERSEKLNSLTNLDVGTKLTRVRSDIVFTLIDGKMKWRDFAVLVAIYAGCFDPKGRKAVSLKMSQIGAMALGYGSNKYLHAHDAESLSLNDTAIGYTVEKLRGVWFVKASPNNGRTTYYSNRLSEAEMITYVAKIKHSKAKTKKLSSREIQRQVNAAATNMSMSRDEKIEELR